MVYQILKGQKEEKCNNSNIGQDIEDDDSNRSKGPWHNEEEEPLG